MAAPVGKPTAPATVVTVRYEAAERPSYALRLTLPKRWLHKEKVAKLVGTFTASYHAAHSHRLEGARLWHGSRELAADANIGDALAAALEAGDVELEIHAAGDAPTTSEVVEYVPRLLARKTPLTLAELRESNQRSLNRRATALVELFGVPAEELPVRAVRRVTSGEGEVLCVQCSRTILELATLPKDADDGYDCASARVWNVAAGFLPEETVHAGGFLVLSREQGKVVASAHGRRWTARVRFDGEKCHDPAKLGAVLGEVHKAAALSGLHGHALKLVELKPRTLAERVFEDEPKWIPAALDAEHAALYAEVLSAELASLPTTWIHGRFGPRTVRQHRETRRVVIDGLEAGREGFRVEDFYFLYVGDSTRRGLVTGVARLGVALRAYATAFLEWPFSVAEIAKIADVFRLCALRDLATCVKEEGTNAQNARTLEALSAIDRDAELIADAMRDVAPKLLTNDAPTMRLLTASEAADREIGTLRKVEEQEPVADDDAKPEEKGFWASWGAKAARNKTKLGAFRQDDSKRLAEIDVLQGKLEAAEADLQVPVDFELCRGLSAGVGAEKVRLEAAEGSALKTLGGKVAGVVIELARDPRRVANVAEDLRRQLPEARVLRAVDALVEADLERALVADGSLDADLSAWRERALVAGTAERPSRGQLACAASHRAAWRLILLSEGASQCVVLEDGARLASAFVDRLALLVADLPADYDIAHLHIPRALIRDDAPYLVNEKRSQRLNRCYAPAASLRAYVVSRKGCGRLLKLTESLRAPIDLTVHELCVNGDLIALTARTSLLMESSIIKVAASSEDLPSNIDHTPPWSPDLL